jgi:hypothetical protein
MAWIKRNLMLVIGGVIALALLAAAGLFLMDRLKQDAAVTEELDTKIAAFKALLDRPVHPGSGKINNIQAAKEEYKRLESFLQEERAVFGPPIQTNRLNNKEFRALLDNTIDYLQTEAERSGVVLPSKEYWFTFAAQKTMVEFAPQTLVPLSAELADIRSICELLYKARVNAITRLKRVPVAREDSGPLDYTTYKAITNELAVITPYEVTFQGFSSELEHVLEAFASAPQFFLVKNVAVDSATNPNQIPGMNPIADAAVVRPMPREGGGPGFRRPPPGMPPGVRPSGRGPVTLLDENKLKFHLRVDVVKIRASK